MFQILSMLMTSFFTVWLTVKIRNGCIYWNFVLSVWSFPIRIYTFNYWMQKFELTDIEVEYGFFSFFSNCHSSISNSISNFSKEYSNNVFQPLNLSISQNLNVFVSHSAHIFWKYRILNSIYQNKTYYLFLSLQIWPYSINCKVKEI